ncbi:unnamed protein product [Thelazia callipaeda]|uniref:Uncharacterized protein n=1 Tax=Thelazia callipaeda TaxID=103827 RepID=A0A0N5D4J1_THECL|nr:unnamed protein product [Thelazia callipaeda]
MSSYRQIYPTSLSSSYHQDISYPRNNIGLSKRYGSIDRLATSTTLRTSISPSTFGSKRTASYGSALYLNDTGTSSLRRYDIPAYERRSSNTPSRYANSSYTPSYSTSSWRDRSQTPSYSRSRERISIPDRDYKSMSRHPSDKEDSKSVDNIEQKFEQLYNRYVKDQKVESTDVSNNVKSNTEFSGGEKYLSYSEVEGDDDDDELSLNNDEFTDVIRGIAELNKEANFEPSRNQHEMNSTSVKDAPCNDKLSLLLASADKEDMRSDGSSGLMVTSTGKFNLAYK